MTIMKDRPMLVADAVSRAIREGRQTQDRRPIEVQPPQCGFCSSAWWRYWDGITPPWAVDDTVWLREAWATTEQAGYHPADAEYVYRATDPEWSTMQGWRWRPSIHMPKTACRTRCRITRVWAERVQDISEADAKAEGVLPNFQHDMILPAPYAEAFADLWESLYPGSWERNDWVWCREFELITEVRNVVQ